MGTDAVPQARWTWAMRGFYRDGVIRRGIVSKPRDVSGEIAVEAVAQDYEGLQRELVAARRNPDIGRIEILDLLDPESGWVPLRG